VAAIAGFTGHDDAETALSHAVAAPRRIAGESYKLKSF
jgi:hypothetical protein